MILIQVLNCYEEQMSTVQILELTIFSVSSLPKTWVTGFGRLWSAVTNLGVWDWVFSPCQRDPYLFLAHMPPSHFFQPPNLQLEEVAHKMILPLTSSLIYWLLPRLGHKELVDTPLLCLWWQNCNNRGEDGSSGWRASPSFCICDLMSVAITCHLFRCFYKKSTSEWVKAADWY